MRIKRYLVTLLALCMVLASFAAAAFTVRAKSSVNVAKGKTYTGTEPYQVDKEKYPATNYRQKNGTELTDGVKSDSSGTVDNRWYAFYTAGTWHIDIDLGKKQESLCEFNTEFLEIQDWGIWFPESVSYYGSDDGNSFTLIGESTKTETGSSSLKEYRLRMSNPVSYRYVRMELVSIRTFAFASEIEVLQGEATYEDTFSLRDRVYLRLQGDAIRIPPNTDASAIPSMINSMDGVTIVDANGNEKASGVLKTGDELRKRIHSTGDIDIYFFVLDGDVTGDGAVKANDYLVVKRMTMKSATLTGAALTAADVNADNNVNAKDYALIKRHVLKTYDLYETYGPTDGRGDVTSKFAAKINIKDRIENPETWDMTVKRTTSVQYEIRCKTDFGDLRQTFHQTKWGTWNLGGWELTDSEGKHTFATESTDLEYVYRAGKTKSSSVFSGGNHANEKLRSIKLFDGTTNKEIVLNIGESTSVKQLRITEETKLYYDPAGDDGKYNYSEDDMYCYAVRNYTIVGPQTRLEVDYDYKKDVYYGLSYTCMMPVSKVLGLYCAYVDENGKLDKIYETLKVGDPSYNGAFYLSNAATRAILFGYGKTPGSISKYRLDVRVDPATDVLNPAGKERARFWDMNADSNKLYFCIYGNGDLVSAGSKRHTSAQWTVYVD